MENIYSYGDFGQDPSIPDQFMDHRIAYQVLRKASYMRADHIGYMKIIRDYTDDDNEIITIPPIRLAMELFDVETDKIMPTSIFLFIEKAFWDFREQWSERNVAFDLGRLYFEEIYGHVDFVLAFENFSLAEEQQLGDAYRYLGMCHYLGLGTAVNYHKAYDAFIKMVLGKEDAVSLMYLGDMYRKGEHVEKDIAMANDLYYRAFRCALGGEYQNRSIYIADIHLRMADSYSIREDPPESDLIALSHYSDALVEFHAKKRTFQRNTDEGIALARKGQLKMMRRLKKYFEEKRSDPDDEPFYEDIFFEDF